MNSRAKLLVIWGAIVAFIIFAVNGIGHLFGGFHHFSNGSEGRFRQGGTMGQQNGGFRQGGMMGHGGFEHHGMMYGSHHGGVHLFGSLLCIIIIIAIVILVLKWLRRKTKVSSMNQFIDTSFTGSQTPGSNMNGSILDQWEKSIKEKKENEENGTV